VSVPGNAPVGDETSLGLTLAGMLSESDLASAFDPRLCDGGPVPNRRVRPARVRLVHVHEIRQPGLDQ
jgi:hypothetical protein